ncbi:MAG: transposase [Ruminococcaceae bacterium]|nr:transposase [Oscillospiraceae bacterium]
MDTNKRAYQMLVLIATHKLVDKATELFLNMNLPIQYRLNAEGTASSEILDALGLGSVDKSVLISTVPQGFGEQMLQQLHNQLRLDAVNSGIAFTIPLTGASNLMIRMMTKIDEDNEFPQQGKGENTMTGNKHTLVIAIVDRGFSDDVMVAARAAGAGGGTVIHSRGIENEDATGFWGLSVQEEKELVLILAEVENKVDIMRAISEKCGMHSEAKGLVMSLPIDAVMGI